MFFTGAAQPTTSMASGVVEWPAATVDAGDVALRACWLGATIGLSGEVGGAGGLSPMAPRVNKRREDGVEGADGFVLWQVRRNTLARVRLQS